MKLYILHIAPVACLALLAASCSIIDDEPEGAVEASGATQVAFTLRLEGAGAATRAGTTWNDEYDSDNGIDYDRRIDNLQVVIYNEALSSAYPLENLTLEESNSTEGTYTFVGTVDENSGLVGNQEYKIMVFANCPDVSENTNIGVLSYEYVHTSSYSTTPIPMWGVATATLSLEQGKRQVLDEDIDLLRALAKVEVSMDYTDGSLNGYDLKDVSIDYSNTKGYCLPAGYSEVDATKELDQEDNDGAPASFHPLASLSTDALDFSKDDNGSYFLYLPEYRNIGSVTPAEIQVTVTKDGAESTTYPLEFKMYSDGKAQENADYFDIVRNHLYRYTITGIEEEGDGLRFYCVIKDLEDGGVYNYEY